MYSPQRGDVSQIAQSISYQAGYSPHRGDVSDYVDPLLSVSKYSPHRGDVSFPKIKFIVAPVSSTQ